VVGNNVSTKDVKNGCKFGESIASHHGYLGQY